MREGELREGTRIYIECLNETYSFHSLHSGNRSARGQTYQRVAVAHLQDSPSEIPLHLRPVLPAQGDQPRTVRLLCAREDCRRQSDCQVEEVRLREPVLPALHSDARHQLRHELHLPCAEGEAGGGPRGGVRALRLPRVLRIDGGGVALYAGIGMRGRTFKGNTNKRRHYKYINMVGLLAFAAD